MGYHEESLRKQGHYKQTLINTNHLSELTTFEWNGVDNYFVIPFAKETDKEDTN